MKKILTLLALLVTTVAAMAFDYTDVRSASEDGEPDYEVSDAKLTITQNDDGTYNVTFHNLQAKYGSSVDDFGTFEYRNLSGTTENGITTISESGLTGYISEISAGNPTKGTLYVKFTETKAYATLDTQTQTYNAQLVVKYGTDENWPSTGGGTVTPVEEYPINFDKSATASNSSRWISNISLQVTGGEKQVISVTAGKGYVDTTTGDDKFVVPAGSEVTPSFAYNAEWMHGYIYIDLNNDKQFSYNADGDDQTGTELVAYSYLNGKNSKGESVAASCNVFPPSFTAPTTPGTYRIRYKIDWDNVDPGGSMKSGNTILANGGGIWDATLVVEEAETPFQPSERTATDVANATYNGTTTNYNNHQVVVNEYEQGKYKVTYKDLTIGSNRLGDLTIDNVTATENDGVLTLTTTDTFGTWSNKNTSSLIGFLIPDETSNISDFTATLTNNETDGSIAKLDLSFGLAIQSQVASIVFGKKGALSYSNTLYVRTGDQTQTFSATLKVLDKGEGKYDITLPSFDDANGNTIPGLTFEAEGTEQDGKIVYTATDADAGELANGSHAYVTIVSAQSISQIFNGRFEVKLGDTETATLGFGVSLWEAKTTNFTAPANITYNEKTINIDEASLVMVEDPENTYALTYKNVTTDGNVIGDFSINNLTATKGENTLTLATVNTQGTWSNVTEGNALGVTEGATASIRDFEGTITTNGETQTALVKFGIGANDVWVDVVFGEKKETPKPECEYTDVVEHGYAPAGQSWQKTGVAIDWDTQYIKAEIDLSTCKTNGSGPENILTIGDDLTGWSDGPHYHFYYNATDKVLQYNYLNSAKKDLNSGNANLSKAYLNAEGVVTIELSKKHGLKINGESCLVKYVPTANSPSTNGTESWTEDDLENVFGNLWAMSEIGFGGCQGSTMSNATYNYIHILALPAEVVSENTYKNSLTLVDNTTSEKYLDLEEAEAVVTRYNDNTVKLTFKNITLNDKTSDLSFTGKYAETEEPSTQADETEEFTPVVFTISDAQGDDAVKELFGGDVTLNANGKLLAEDNLYLAYTLATSDGDYKGEFGSLPVEDITVVENYQADGNGFTYTEPIDWDKQKVVMSINVAPCQRSVEHLFGVGADGTSWTKNVHCYWSTGNNLQCYWDGADGMGNNNTDKFDCNETVLVEITKAEGLVIDGATKIAASRMDGLYDMSTIVIASGEGSSQESYALYNYIKIVDLDWNDPTNGINNAGATAIDGAAQIFTVTGSKVNSLQKGINIVRTADGKTVKVLVK